MTYYEYYKSFTQLLYEIRKLIISSNITETGKKLNTKVKSGSIADEIIDESSIKKKNVILTYNYLFFS